MSSWTRAAYLSVSQAATSTSNSTSSRTRPDGSSPSSSSRSPGSTRGRSVSFRGDLPEGAAPDWRHRFAQVSYANVACGLAVVGLVASGISLSLGARGKSLSASSSSATRPSSAVLVHSSTGLRRGGEDSSLRRERLPGDSGHLGGGFEEGPSLWCYALMMPWGYEPDLLAAQLSRGVGIFACDEYAVFSNGSTPVLCPPREAPMGELGKQDNPKVPIAGGRESFITLPIGGDLHVEFGGKWYTAMNTDIFIKVWNEVINLGAYKKHHWTVKADPDSVFFAARLRQMVIDEPTGAIYLNNCKFGLHGPLEVMTREAIDLYAARQGECEGIRRDGMDMSSAWDDEDHAFGEDEFIHRCFDHLRVKRVDELGLLLSETACDQESVPCDEGKVAFHPFKSNKDYFDCWDTARGSSSAWARAMFNAPMPYLVSSSASS